MSWAYEFTEHRKVIFAVFNNCVWIIRSQYKYILLPQMLTDEKRDTLYQKELWHEANRLVRHSWFRKGFHLTMHECSEKIALICAVLQLISIFIPFNLLHSSTFLYKL